MKDFSPPLSRLATGFVETWEFERLDDGTRVVRSFEMHPKSALDPARALADFVPAEAGRRPAPAADAPGVGTTEGGVDERPVARHDTRWPGSRRSASSSRW